jgi:hypothetical protein
MSIAINDSRLLCSCFIFVLVCLGIERSICSIVSKRRSWQPERNIMFKRNQDMTIPSAIGCFLSRLLKEKLGPDACPNVKIINDNALVLQNRPLVVHFELSNERHNKSQQHIASRWGDCQELNGQNRHDDAQLRPMPIRSSELAFEEVRTEGLSRANDRATCVISPIPETFRGINGQHLEEEGNGDFPTQRKSQWRNAALSLSEPPFSDCDRNTSPGNDTGCKHTRVLHFTTKALSISSSSPRLPRQRKSFVK